MYFCFGVIPSSCSCPCPNTFFLLFYSTNRHVLSTIIYSFSFQFNPHIIQSSFLWLPDIYSSTVIIIIVIHRLTSPTSGRRPLFVCVKLHVPVPTSSKIYRRRQQCRSPIWPPDRQHYVFQILETSVSQLYST